MDEYFEELKELVDDSFLERNLKCRIILNEETLEEKEEYITLRSILSFNLSEEEEVFLINYLGSLGISVSGVYSYYSGICDNYMQSGHFRSKDLYVFTEEEQKEYLEEYQRTKDIEIRNKVVESNLPLVKYFSRKYSYLYDVEQEFLESYGVEGAILAIDHYDSTKGKLSTFLSFMVRDFIWRGLIESYLGDSRNFLIKINRTRDKDTRYYEYFYTKIEVEKQTGKSLKDNPELIDEIMLQLANKNYCKDKFLDELSKIVSIINGYSYDQIKDKLDCTDDSSLYDEVLENVFQQELTSFMSGVIEELPEKERTVLQSYYGLGRKKECSLGEIAEETQVVYETARLREAKARQKMKKKLKSYKYQSMAQSFLENSNHEYENPSSFAYHQKR